jgi:peptidoglycan hydrolase CwlO-like protein
MRVFGIVLTIVIVIGLGAAVYSQKDRFGSTSTSADTLTQLQDAQRNNAAEISDLQKQVQGLKAQLLASGQQDIADLKNRIAAEQGERKLLSDQLGGLSARVNSLVKANAAEMTPPPASAARQRRR